MRQIGILSNERDAQKLVDYLLAQGIRAQAEAERDGWAIWVREENQLQLARELLEAFEQDADNPKYAAARSVAQQLRVEDQRQRAAAARRNVDMRRQWNQPLTRRAPLVMVLIGLSVFVSLATQFAASPPNQLMRALMFSDPRPVVRRAPDAYPPGSLPNDRGMYVDYLSDLKDGQIWRMVTPIFLHGDILHLLFNMWWMYVLGAQLEARRGTVRFGALVLVLALISNWAQFLIGGSPNFLGMSGVVYGIFGYLWITLRLDPRAGYLLGEATVFIMLLFLVLGFVGVFPGLANWAHAGGLIAGMAIAYLQSLMEPPHGGRVAR